ncbi:Monooxygenase AgnR1 [Aspergillus pseudonomiae]
MNSQRCAAVVVGAGPAGLAVIGNLLEKQLGGKIAWIDPYFQAGRVNRKYREVPSNTKVALFQAYATAVQPFRSVINSTRIPSPFSTMAKLDQEKTCHLHHAADMVRALSEGITKMDQVYACRGYVTAANLVENTSSWTVRIQRADHLDEVEVITPRLILCTGSSPTEVPIPVCGQHIERLDLDVVLRPSDLVSYLPRNEPRTVGVVGASHSAILALLNLVDLAHRVRRRLCRQQLEEDKLPHSEAGRFITKVDCGGGQEAAQYERHLPSCTHLVQAVGFTRDPLPELSVNGHLLDPEFDSVSGGFHDATGRIVPGLHGAGIAFPERVVDPYGNVEHAVGFWKFMKFIKRVSPQWTA